VGVGEEEDNARDVRLLLVVPSPFLHFLLSKTSGRASNPKKDAPTREANLLRRQRSMVKRRNESQKNIERRRRRR
jgi:hypothetical protein